MLVASVVSFTVFSHAIVSFSFWMNLVASYVAITAIWIYIRHVMLHMDRFKQLVPGYTALGIVLVMYLICVMIYSLFTGLADHGLRWFVLLHTVTAALAVILCGIMLIYIRSASHHEADEQMKTANLRSIENALQQLLHTMEDHSILTMEEDRKAVQSLVELVKYSDPITPVSLEYSDRQILIDIELLNGEIATQYAAGGLINSERLTSQLSRLKSRLKERNQQIVTSKS
jgi:low affinity Fe/Cu permease